MKSLPRVLERAPNPAASRGVIPRRMDIGRSAESRGPVW